MKNFSEQATKALEMIQKAHEGQFRKDGKTPYFTHPYEVAKLVQKYVSEDDDVMIIAALAHDCVEDVEDFDLDEFVNELYGVEDTLKSQKDRIKVIVLAMTKNNTILGRHAKDIDSYERIYMTSCGQIKLCDRYHNLSDMDGTKTAFQIRYVAETYFMLGFFENLSNSEIYRDLMTLAEKKLNELTKKCI